MGSYKTAKEAFVADNPGSSVHYINAISLTALTGYALYATACRRLSAPQLDYVTTVLPLLLAVTVCSSRPLLLNVVIGGAAWILGVTGPAARRPPQLPKSAGRWLAESDSEDEGGVNVTPARRPKVKLPSELVAQAAVEAEAERRRASSSSSLNSPLSPTELHARRRASPSPGGSTIIDMDDRPRPPRGPASPLPSPIPSTRGGSASHSPLNSPTRTKPPNSEHENEHHRRPGQSPRRSRQQPPRAHLPFLSVYRAHMMVMTVVCILAVDFPVFPRVLGKTENTGTGLMDVGVGSFVFSLGIVSSKAFGTTRKGKMTATLLGALRRAAPVLALGFIRLLMVKGVEYPEHVSEYGVHWNFFFTLGLVPALATALMPLRGHYRWSSIALVICFTYQLILAFTPGLETFLYSNSRPNLLAANKEGLASLPGYLAIFLVGLSAGEHMLSLGERRRRRSTTKWTSGNETDDEFSDAPNAVSERAGRRRPELALELAGYAAGSWAVLAACSAIGWPVSRRLANAPYVLWTVAYNTSYLAGYLFIEIWLFAPNDSRHCPPLLEAINSNGLIIFLVANLGTGIINVSMQTMYASTPVAMVVLVGYTIAVCAVAWQLRSVRIKI